ncbi:amino-acid N-acetyltransferase [Glutamicibacter soli]|uniref:Amino-acid N-acetyltransferase n=1 Tax=Glutamicibacter soli TaxID=453836 RepID=A0A365Y8L7_9MICC|nr:MULTISPECIES: amino-acid N-acetyltransferase [Micrococcaceae]ALD62699.1 N-acetylglutamate synthase [Arthrobacter sp. LS16]ALQ32146.1 N-acetylglutamate synthase [Arthrobacter sp. YC-RL1]KLI90593.1 N-acetylglutamate synthase [Arthrobacter sp. YC-RL1]NAZ17412.1 amino-acid N-acetyltransferase [Glutamicibacter soli]RBL99025.1 amino-acid N-acetyltransferase [Glutamicibacter soli]
MNTFTVRSAKTTDVPAIRNLVRPLAEERILLDKEAVTYYESIQEFVVAEDADGNVVGCGGLHVIWEDIAEIRTLATSADLRGKGVGHVLLKELLQRARQVGVHRVFCLTFEVKFFERQGFSVMADQSAVDPSVYQEILLSRDEGVAEFLDLARVKPNTLGNTRMIISL